MPRSSLWPVVPLMLAVNCAHPIPVRRAAPAAAVRSGLPVLKPCLLVAERNSRPLFEGLDAVSFDTWRMTLAAVVIPHPSGLVIIDPPIGRQVAADLARSPLHFKTVMGRSEDKVPTAVSLERLGVDPARIRTVLITHSHWDHVGGLRDLPRARVLLRAEELDFVKGLTAYIEHGTMRHMLKAVLPQLVPYRLEDGPYEAFEASRDLFGDGTVIAVPLPGHTPGSAGYFVNSGDGHRWLFTGDVSWTVEGLKRPAHKNPLAGALVDFDPETLTGTLGVLNAYQRDRPDVALIPSHDLAALDQFPECRPEDFAGH